jgi:hypothetical protein
MPPTAIARPRPGTMRPAGRERDVVPRNCSVISTRRRRSGDSRFENLHFLPELVERPGAGFGTEFEARRNDDERCRGLGGAAGAHVVIPAEGIREAGSGAVRRRDFDGRLVLGHGGEAGTQPTNRQHKNVFGVKSLRASPPECLLRRRHFAAVVAARKQVAVGIHGHDNRRMPEPLLHDLSR